MPWPLDSDTSRSPTSRPSGRRHATAPGSLRHSHALNLPLQVYAALRLHAAAHFFAQRFDVVAGAGAGVDQKIGVLLADLRAADRQPAAACRVSELPRLVPIGFLAGRTARLPEIERTPCCARVC